MSMDQLKDFSKWLILCESFDSVKVRVVHQNGIEIGIQQEVRKFVRFVV